MNLNCDNFIKQEFINAEEKLINSLPSKELNVPIKNEPILDEPFPSVSIKNEPLSEKPSLEGAVTAIKTENVLQSVTGDSFIIYNLDTTSATNKLHTTLPQQTSKQMLNIISPLTPQLQISNVTQRKHSSVVSNSNQINVCNIKKNHVADITSAAAVSPPILLNSQLRKRHKVILPINPINKKTRYNIEGTTMPPPVDKNSVRQSFENSSESGIKKIINHIIKLKRNKRRQDYDAFKESLSLPKNSDETETSTKNSSISTGSNQNSYPISSSHDIIQTTTNTQTELHLFNNTLPLSVTPNSPKQSVEPLIVSELRVKCLCRLTDNSITTENSDLKDFFMQMFEETRRLNKTQQREVKMSLLKAISDAEELVEQGKCCSFL